ncbi:AraC family transcriptional regulator [Paenibacillus sp. GSMTC-2017]|uniref:AraC family transcriptional regulator n=1 Tax=Paenibacillus sp. GSMTC-2017 TaxID=2794350 RepID=UPI0018D76DEF|nr:AraC family transcriptional regulator [Paenibacillus sp. GSMTC-2017]MBH5319076.1 AraC family transcriptional regulator [Paenibacillus sp. GSMTC-2017]
MYKKILATHSEQLDVLDTTWWKLRSIERLGRGEDKWELLRHFSDAHVMIITSKGSGWISADGEYNELASNSTYIYAAGQLMDGSFQFQDSGKEQGIFLLTFNVLQDTNLSSKSSLPLIGTINPSSPVTIWSLCESLELIWKENSPLERLRGSILFHELLYRLIRDRLSVKELELEGALEYVRSYIEMHYQDDLTIETLSSLIGISQRHFVRLFKRKFGCGAIEYLTKFRIREAQRLMQSGAQHRIRDIARHVGYHDDSYFRRKFKQVTGIPPATFISNQNLQIVAYHRELIGQLLALGFTPCAAPEAHPWTNYYRRKFITENLLPLSENKADVIQALKSIKVDYIFGLDQDVSDLEKNELHAIAPVCLVPVRNQDWGQRLHYLAKFLKVEHTYDRWLAAYDLKVNLLKELIQHTIGKDTMLVVKINGLNCSLAGTYSPATVLFDDLEIPRAYPVPLDSDDIPISLEQLGQMEFDRMFVLLEREQSSNNEWINIQHSEQWLSLPAVKQGKVDVLSAEPFGEYTAFTHELLIIELSNIWRDRA